MMKTTYGVVGMVEWLALIPAGRTVLRVRFSGGTASGGGIPVATYSTANPAVMRVIEESCFFRNGRIRLISHDGSDDGSDEMRIQEHKAHEGKNGRAGGESAPAAWRKP